jgi:hypothetical protein
MRKASTSFESKVVARKSFAAPVETLKSMQLSSFQVDHRPGVL